MIELFIGSAVLVAVLVIAIIFRTRIKDIPNQYNFSEDENIYS